MTKAMSSHREVVDQKVQILHLSIANIQREGRSLGFDENLISQMCHPYFKLLHSIYEEEFPFVKAIEESDLVLRLEGPAANIKNPRVSLITTVFSRVRIQVANVAKTIASLSDSRRAMPQQLDLGLSAFARGSLVLGFTLPPPEGLQPSETGQKNLLAEQDPLYRAAREAIRTIGMITEQISANPTEEAIDKVYESMPDPEVRDATLNAISKLAPTSRGIERVSLSGKDAAIGNRVLTSQTKKLLKPVLASPVRSNEEGAFIGEVREIDLDLKRFVIRNIENENINQLRCSFNFRRDDHARDLLTQRIKVIGKIERDAAGRVG